MSTPVVGLTASGAASKGASIMKQATPMINKHNNTVCEVSQRLTDNFILNLIFTINKPTRR
jgi:hypothetical protein